MNFPSKLIFLLFKVIIAILHFLDGYKEGCLACSLQPTLTQDFEISFLPNQFARAPQVIIIPIITGVVNNGNYVGFQVSITSTTTTKFTVQLKALSCIVSDFTFKWVAFDDQRVTVLTQFNLESPLSKSLPHNNANAKKGFIILQSFAGTSQITFTLQLGAITETTAQVDLVSTGLEQIGYIVVIGPDDFFTIGDPITLIPKNVVHTDRFIQNFTNVENKIQLFYAQSFGFTVNRPYALQILPYFGTDRCSYEFCSWSGYQQSFTAFVHQQTLINFDLVSNNPLKFRKCKIANYYTYSQQNAIELTIKEISKTYSQPIANDKVIIPSNYSQITFILTIKCTQNYQILAKYFQCTSCTQKQTKNFCYLAENFLRIEAIFKQDGVAQEQLYVTITSNQIQISQTIVNPAPESILLIQYNIN